MKTHRRTTATNIANQNASQAAASSISSDPRVESPEKLMMSTQKKVTHVPKDAAIVVKYNAGWGNILYVHGKGDGLDWDNGKGSPMTNISEDCWVWTAPAKDKHGAISFKITINNGEIWAEGDNIELKPGEKTKIEPKFLKSR